MIKNAKIPARKCSKVAVLMVVYFMHMVLFQALMAGPVNTTENNNFKPLFWYTHKTPPAHSPTHPAVSYYTMLIKQGNSGLKSCVDIFVSFTSVESFFDVNPSILIERAYHLLPHTFAHTGDDNFKLYRVLRTFLI